MLYASFTNRRAGASRRAASLSVTENDTHSSGSSPTERSGNSAHTTAQANAPSHNLNRRSGGGLASSLSIVDRDVTTHSDVRTQRAGDTTTLHADVDTFIKSNGEVQTAAGVTRRASEVNIEQQRNEKTETQAETDYSATVKTTTKSDVDKAGAVTTNTQKTTQTTNATADTEATALRPRGPITWYSSPISIPSSSRSTSPWSAASAAQPASLTPQHSRFSTQQSRFSNQQSRFSNQPKSVLQPIQSAGNSPGRFFLSS